jgi:hypothetical protein
MTRAVRHTEDGANVASDPPKDVGIPARRVAHEWIHPRQLRRADFTPGTWSFTHTNLVRAAVPPADTLPLFTSPLVDRSRRQQERTRTGPAPGCGARLVPQLLAYDSRAAMRPAVGSPLLAPRAGYVAAGRHRSVSPSKRAEPLLVVPQLLSQRGAFVVGAATCRRRPRPRRRARKRQELRRRRPASASRVCFCERRDAGDLLDTSIVATESTRRRKRSVAPMAPRVLRAFAGSPAEQTLRRNGDGPSGATT